MATVVNVKKKYLLERGIMDFEEWNSLPNTVYIGRNMSFYVKGTNKSKWANPFSVKKYGREECLEKYREYILNNQELYSQLSELEGKELGCWCYPEKCHGNILIEEMEKQKNIIQGDKWTYYKQYIDESYFNKLYPLLSEKCHSYNVKMFGKVYSSRRLSCIFSNDTEHFVKNVSPAFNYSDVTTFPWSEASNDLLSIKSIVEKLSKVEFGYVLCHIYRDNTDYLGWHYDKEALKTPIASVSLGSERRFQIKKKDKKGDRADFEYKLGSGDIIIMHGPTEKSEGCQQLYKHRVPKESKERGPRINLTFRCFEN